MVETKSLMRVALLILGILLFIAGLTVFFIIQGEEIDNGTKIILGIKGLIKE
ncbi:MAG: cysteine-rich outer membrane protein [Candidatus Hodarchaeota archaeon]